MGAGAGAAACVLATCCDCDTPGLGLDCLRLRVERGDLGLVELFWLASCRRYEIRPALADERRPSVAETLASSLRSF